MPPASARSVCWHLPGAPHAVFACGVLSAASAFACPGYRRDASALPLPTASTRSVCGRPPNHPLPSHHLNVENSKIPWIPDRRKNQRGHLERICRQSETAHSSGNLFGLGFRCKALERIFGLACARTRGFHPGVEILFAKIRLVSSIEAQEENNRSSVSLRRLFSRRLHSWRSRGERRPPRKPLQEINPGHKGSSPLPRRHRSPVRRQIYG